MFIKRKVRQRRGINEMVGSILKPPKKISFWEENQNTLR